VVVDVSEFLALCRRRYNGIAAMVKNFTHRANLAKVIRFGFVPVTKPFSCKTSVNCADNSAVGKTNSLVPLWPELENEVVTAP
jgi:hypothetical protein